MTINPCRESPVNRVTLTFDKTHVSRTLQELYSKLEFQF